jgi:vacuolar-type H+-ATPase subunit D/Vma8
MPNAMEINFQPIPSWALVSTNPWTSDTNLIPPLEPIKLNSVPQWGQTLMTQLQHMATEIRNLRSQIQGDKTEAYRIFMGMQNDYHKIESNLNNAIVMAQQHAAEATGAHFNLTMAQFAEVAAAYMALRRHVESIAISNAADEE